MRTDYMLTSDVGYDSITVITQKYQDRHKKITSLPKEAIKEIIRGLNAGVIASKGKGCLSLDKITALQLDDKWDKLTREDLKTIIYFLETRC